MTPIERFLEVAPGARRSGAGWSDTCPAHDDRRASLSIAESSTDGKVLLLCHAGCRIAAIVKAFGLDESDLFPSKDENGRRIVAEYAYTDEGGVELFQCVRYEPRDFRQRHRLPGGGWAWNLKDVRRVLYRLPALIEGIKTGATVFVVEGEKDVDALRALGLVASCNPLGAEKWRSEYADFFAGARVVVIADRDAIGRRHAATVAKSLRGKASFVRVVEVDEGKDAADWIARGAMREDFEALAEREDAERGMGLGYQQIERKIFDSSVAKHYMVRVVFQDFLMLADWRTGRVDMTIDAIARRTNVPEELVRDAITKLEAPDPESRNQTAEGRRLLRLDPARPWGWKIVTYGSYRDAARREGKRRRQADYRERKESERVERVGRINGSPEASRAIVERLAAEGQSIRAIAVRTHVSKSTVQRIVRSIKTGPEAPR